MGGAREFFGKGGLAQSMLNEERLIKRWTYGFMC